MRRTGISVVVMAVLGLALAVSTARAGSGGGLWLGGFGSWSNCSMKDINQLLVAINGPKIQGVGGFGLETGVDLRRLAFGLGYERLFVARDGQLTNRRGVSQIHTEFPANAFYGLVEYKLRASGSVRARLGVAGGLASLAPVSYIAFADQRILPLVLTGMGPLFGAYAMGEWWTAPHVAFFGSAGYRSARVKSPKDTYTGDTFGDSIDYSGGFARLGVKLSLTK
jgi:hypothetical protein